MKISVHHNSISTSFDVKITYYALKAILYIMIGYIVVILIVVFIVPELSGYKEKFEFKEIKTGQSIF